MKQEWKDYFQEINLPERLFANIECKVEEVQSIFGSEITQVFVSNRKTEQGIEFLSLWLFSINKAFECKNFISSEDYDMVYIRNNVSYVSINKINCTNIDNPMADSVLISNNYLANTNLSCSFNAVGRNCKYLMDILKSMYIPNMITK